MYHFQLGKMIFAVFVAFIVGVGLIISAFVEKKGAPGFADLYPGLSIFAAGFVYIFLLKYPTGPVPNDQSAETNPSSETNNAPTDIDH